MDVVTLEKFKSLLNQNTALSSKEYQIRKEKLQEMLLVEYEKCEGRYFDYYISSYLNISEHVPKLVEYLAIHNKNGEIIDTLLRMKEENTILFTHSVRVSYLCLILTVGALVREKEKQKRMIDAKGVYETELLIQNGLAGLLHDIGKMVIDFRRSKKIWNKKEEMTPMEHQRYREHVIKGHYFLKNNGIIGGILYGVLQHHENCAGKGFPMKLKEEDINETGKIVAIANNWEHLTEDVKDFSVVDPFMLVRVMSESNLALEHEYVAILWENLLSKFIGEKVLLTNGSVGELYKINAKTPTKSMIRLSQKLVNLEYDFIEIEKLVNE